MKSTVTTMRENRAPARKIREFQWAYALDVLRERGISLNDERMKMNGDGKLIIHDRAHLANMVEIGPGLTEKGIKEKIDREISLKARQQRDYTTAKEYFYTCGPVCGQPEKLYDVLRLLSSFLPYSATVEAYLTDWNAHYITRAMDEIRKEKAA